MSLRSDPLVSLEYNKLLCHLDCKLVSAPKLLSEHGACTLSQSASWKLEVSSSATLALRTLSRMHLSKISDWYVLVGPPTPKLGTYLRKGSGHFKGNQFCIFFILNKLYGVHLGSSLLGDYSCVISKAGQSLTCLLNSKRKPERYSPSTESICSDCMMYALDCHHLVIIHV